MLKRTESIVTICIIAIACLVLFLIGKKIGIIDSIFQSSAENTLKVDYLPCAKEKDVSGLMDAKGNFYALNYDDIGAPIINGFGVIDGTLYRIGNNPSDTIPILKDVHLHGIMNDGLMPVCRENDYITLIDTEGKEAFKLTKIDEKEILGCFGFSDSKLRVMLEDLSFVFIDKEGKKLFDTSYSWATDFRNGYAVVQRKDQNDELFSLIDSNATPIFSFESEDKDYVTVSYDMELLSAKENGHIVIYDFTGKRIHECPSKVSKIYAFSKDGFIYNNENNKFGLMNYKDENLILPIYNQLVLNGNNYLGCNENEVIRLLNNKGSYTNKEFNGEEILDFKHVDCDYPNVIKSLDDDFIVVDDDGNVIGEGVYIDYDQQDDLELISFIKNDYFPSDTVLNTIIELCGDGNDVSDRYGAFINRSDTFCTPQNITFLSQFSMSDLEDKNYIKQNISKGINYNLDYGVVFDESIVLRGEKVVNSSARLYRSELSIEIFDWARSVAFRNKCISEFLTRGCTMFYAKGSNCIIENKNILYAILFKNADTNNDVCELTLFMLPNKEDYRSYYKSYLDELAKK